MNTLIVYAHPGHSGHHGYLLNQVQSILDNKKIGYELLDLYKLKYDPILQSEELGGINNQKISEDSVSYQEKIKNSDKLIFIFPTWWQGMPAILKGFFDKVFCSGFAFIYKNGIPIALLKEKRAVVFSATGSPQLINRFLLGNRGMRIIIKNILGFCGIKAKGYTMGSALKLTDKHKKRLISIADEMVDNLYK